MTRRTPSRVVILSDFSKVRGGASKLAVLQAGLLAEHGIPVTYFCGDAGDHLHAGVEVVALGGHRLLDQAKLTAAVSGIWNRAAQNRLAAWIGQNDRSDTIYHVHGYHQTLSPSVLWPLKMVRRRTVMHAHDYFLSCPNGAFFDFRRQKTCGRKAMSASCILCNCDKRSYAQKLWRVTRQALQDQARASLLPDVTTVLLHPDMEQRLFPDGAVSPIVPIANPSEPLLSSPVSCNQNSEFLYIGDLHQYKGVFLLAEGARRAGVKIRFVGDGLDLAELRTGFPEHQFDGWQDRAGLKRAMAKARMLVAPTLGPEPFGLAPVEALICGVPVLASDSLLLSREIRAQKMGASFAAGDTDALTAALGRLSADDDRVAEMATNARSGARLISLTPEAWCNALMTLYGGILQNLGKTPESARDCARVVT
ncbi:glycosyltransferase [Ruegeria atlantica]|uniref:glycosyltransferase n=1 Tax=Ruegeria atlantica TaxID=81569 RepID=UPI00148142DF|nr:glycosyltransferase [Ruegeria atlantica]